MLCICGYISVIHSRIIICQKFQVNNKSDFKTKLAVHIYLSPHITLVAVLVENTVWNEPKSTMMSEEPSKAHKFRNKKY